MIIQIKLKIKKGCRRRNLGFRAWGTGSPSQRAANGGISAKALFFVYTFQLWVLFVFDLIFGALGTCIHSQRAANGAIWPRTIIRPARYRPMACELKTRFDVFWKICKSPFARNPFCYKNSRYALQGTNGLGKHNKINFIPIVWKVTEIETNISFKLNLKPTFFLFFPIQARRVRSPLERWDQFPARGRVS